MYSRLKKDAAFKDLSFYRYDFFNQYGFGEGDYFEEGEKEILEHLCHRLAEAIGVIDGRWEPYVESSCHNPRYIKFKDLQTGKIVNLHDIEDDDWKQIEQRIEEIIK
jgi:Fe-S-cluster formation regulator IscX/YfhJ